MEKIFLIFQYNSNKDKDKDKLKTSSVHGESATKKAQSNSEAAAAMSKKDELQIDRITRDCLKIMKGFQKLLKKQAKEKETLKKKQNKERALMQKQHSTIIDKMNASNSKINVPGSSVSNSVCNSSNLNSTNANSSATLVSVNGVAGTSGSNNHATVGTIIIGNNSSTNNFLFTDVSGADENENSFKSKVTITQFILNLF